MSERTGLKAFKSMRSIYEAAMRGNGVIKNAIVDMVENLGCEHLRGSEPGWEGVWSALNGYVNSLIGEYGQTEEDAVQSVVDEFNNWLELDEGLSYTVISGDYSKRYVGFYPANATHKEGQPEGATLLVAVMDEGEPRFFWLENVDSIHELREYYTRENPWVKPFNYRLFRPL